MNTSNTFVYYASKCKIDPSVYTVCQSLITSIWYRSCTHMWRCKNIHFGNTRNNIFSDVGIEILDVNRKYIEIFKLIFTWNCK